GIGPAIASRITEFRNHDPEVPPAIRPPAAGDIAPKVIDQFGFSVNLAPIHSSILKHSSCDSMDLTLPLGNLFNGQWRNPFSFDVYQLAVVDINRKKTGSLRLLLPVIR